MNFEQCWLSSENNWFYLRPFLKNSRSALNITDYHWSREWALPKNPEKTSHLTPETFFPICWVTFSVITLFHSNNKINVMESKRNTDFWKTNLSSFSKSPSELILEFSNSPLFSINNKKTHFLADLRVFTSSSAASNVQHWIKDDQKCSQLSLDQRCQN